MIIRKYPIDGLKGQEQIAYGNAVGLGNIRCRPERATAQSLFLLLPFQGDWSVSHLPKALLRDVALARQRKRAFFVLAMCNVALGYYLVAPLGRFGELLIVIKRINRTHLKSASKNNVHVFLHELPLIIH